MGSQAGLRDFQWTTYEKPRAPPPMPSLPPWATQSQSTVVNPPQMDPASSWRRPTSYFGAMKRLPMQPPQAPANNVDDEEQRRYDRNMVEPPPPRQLNGDENEHEWLYNSPGDLRVPPTATTNQREEDSEEQSHPTPPDRCSVRTVDQSFAVPVAGEADSVIKPLETHNAYFRPWKHVGDNNNDGDDSDVATVNKWKVRALSNPFAKRKPTAKPSPPDPEPRDDDENPAAPSPKPIGRTAFPRTPPPRRSSLPNERTELSSTASPIAPHRPRTPTLAPASVSVHSEPSLSQTRPSRSGVRSRETMVLPQLHTPEPPPLENHIDLPSALAHLTDLRRSTAQLAPLDAMEARRKIIHDDEEEDEVARVFKRIPPKPPTQLQQLKQQHAQQKQKHKKGATLDALNEIKRRREERRNAQAEEKQRMKEEVEQHGDDAGYKFRRLIQRYRDALPATQRLKPTGKNNTVAPTQRLCVFVRKRPLAKRELKAKGYDILTCLYATPDKTTLRQELLCHEPKLKVDCSESLEHHSFHFDGVFDDDQDNETVYRATVGPVIPTLVEAASTTSLTVFAYGQTGSGKTYTMKSMYRQAATDLFARLATRGLEVSIHVSFYEIYMNNVNDLLNRRKRVQLMEDGDGVVQLLGLEHVAITSADELMDLIAIGEEARATSANAVHDDSSRSHALLRVIIASADGSNVLARLSMVDLAGSERACDTQSDGKNTRMEGAEINKSLLALKECVRALDRGATHIPFRQSKLTQLLRDSFLCANSKTVMIATVSPCSVSCNHTLNTLRYADRLKEIGAS